MDLIFFLIPVSVLIVTAMVWFFFWAVDHGQFEDMDRAGAKALEDTDETREPRVEANPDHPNT